MEKKYQVFVSSTYEDLIEERKAVIEALLQMNCFPVGMEYFNAADDSQWDVITSLIDECDYYVLIIAGKYGSIDTSTGKSYTQKEYEYAISKNVPVISFVYKNIDKLESGKVEKDKDKSLKLNDFKEKVSKKLWQAWENKDGLASAVVLSLNKLIRSKPRTGWVRYVSLSAEANKQILALKEENESLRVKIKQAEDEDPNGIEDLQQGNDNFEFNMSYYYGERKSIKMKLSWNNIIAILTPILFDEASEAKMKDILVKTIHPRIVEITKRTPVERNTYIEESSFQTIKVQLYALHIIELSDKKRTIKDADTYWKLTPYGLRVMMHLKALRKN